MRLHNSVSIVGPWIFGLALSTTLACAAVACADQATPTPTPVPATPTTTVESQTVSLGRAADRTPTVQPEVTPTPSVSGAKTPLVITNANLKELAEGGGLTEPSERKSEDYALRSPYRNESVFAEGNERATEAGRLGQEERRDHWRNEYRKQLRKVTNLERQIEKLTLDINRLQNQFYATDDPAYRDGVIKVQWDQALADREAAREELAEAEQMLPTIVEEARSQGAQPGWFRGLDEQSVSPTPPPENP